MADTAVALPGKWRARQMKLEAMAFLLLAKLLVSLVRFRRWSRWIGKPIDCPAGGQPVQAYDHFLAGIVRRAAEILPFHTKCLPRAMALHWMLHRRGRSGILALGLLPRELRGTLDDLHAWVEMRGEIVLGENGRQYRPLAKFGFSEAIA